MDLQQSCTKPSISRKMNNWICKEYIKLKNFEHQVLYIKVQIRLWKNHNCTSACFVNSTVKFLHIISPKLLLSSCSEHMESIIITSVTRCDTIQRYSLHYFTPVPIKHCICHLLWQLWSSLDSSPVIYMSKAWCPCTWAAESGSYWLSTEASCARWIFCLDSFSFIAPQMYLGGDIWIMSVHTFDHRSSGVSDHYLKM